MNKSQPTEPEGAPRAAAAPESGWIGADPDGAVEDGAVENSDPVTAAEDTRPTPSGMFGLDALPVDPEPSKPARSRDRSHLRLVPVAAAEAVFPPEQDLPAAPPAPAREPIESSEAAGAELPVPPPAVPPVLPAPDPIPTARPFSLRAELAGLIGIVAIGTAAAVGVDALVGGLNGLPPAYLLVFLASPIWDLLPRRLPARIVVIAAHVAGTIGVWFALAAAPMHTWLHVDRRSWQAELAFGGACLVVGAVHMLITAVLRSSGERAVP